MMISDAGIHRLAICVTIVFHCIVFIFPRDSSDLDQKASSRIDLKEKPLTFAIRERIVQKVVPKVLSTSQEKVRVSEKKSRPKLPKQYPGDQAYATVLQSREPYYPKDAINSGWEGRIDIDVTIDKEGRVVNIVMIQSTGHIILDDAFINIVKNAYVFKSKQVLGDALEDTIRLQYIFEL